MTTHFALRASILALASIFATALFAAFAGTAHADWYGNYNNWYQDETYIGPTWDWNAQSGPGSGQCDGDFDIDDSSCIMSPGYHGYGGGGYTYDYSNGNWWDNNSWDSSISFGNPLFW